jgi:hypothetical protein
MTREETDKYALLTTIRQSSRTLWEHRLGKTQYSLTRYERLFRLTIPLDENHLLLLSFDIETRNVDSIIMRKVIPLIRKT